MNEQLNLTRHTDFEKFVSRDVVDSRWLESFLEPAERVLDVGTGGGARVSYWPFCGPIWRSRSATRWPRRPKR